MGDKTNTPTRGEDVKQNKTPTLAKLSESLRKLAEQHQRDVANARLSYKVAMNRPWVNGK